MNYYIRKNCRLCGSKNLELVLQLANSPLCDSYVYSPIKQDFFPLALELCLNCTFVQLNCVVEPKIIYGEHINFTTISSGLDKHFSNYCHDVCKYLRMPQKSLVVDIGSNDGSLLKEFNRKNFQVIGVDFLKTLSKKTNLEGIKTYPNFFGDDLAKKIVSEFGKAELVTVNNLFANIDDLNAFMRSIDILLSQNGVFVMESSYLYKMIENMVFDFIYHEHLSYISAKPLATFMEQYDLRLIRIQEVSTKGGSLRYYFARMGTKWTTDISVKRILFNELENVQLINLFHKFNQSIEDEKKKINNFLESRNKKIIAGYGASATTTTLISHYELNHHIDFLIDDNPDKIDSFSPGFNLPVFSREKLIRDISPDILIILAWRFKEKIISKLNNFPFKVVIPLPIFEELL